MRAVVGPVSATLVERKVICGNLLLSGHCGPWMSTASFGSTISMERGSIVAVTRRVLGVLGVERQRRIELPELRGEMREPEMVHAEDQARMRGIQPVFASGELG